MNPASRADSLALADALVGLGRVNPASRADSLALADGLVGWARQRWRAEQ